MKMVKGKPTPMNSTAMSNASRMAFLMALLSFGLTAPSGWTAHAIESPQASLKHAGHAIVGEAGRSNNGSLRNNLRHLNLKQHHHHPSAAVRNLQDEDPLDAAEIIEEEGPPTDEEEEKEMFEEMLEDPNVAEAVAEVIEEEEEAEAEKEAEVIAEMEDPNVEMAIAEVIEEEAIAGAEAEFGEGDDPGGDPDGDLLAEELQGTETSAPSLAPSLAPSANPSFAPSANNEDGDTEDEGAPGDEAVEATLSPSSRPSISPSISPISGDVSPEDGVYGEGENEGSEPFMFGKTTPAPSPDNSEDEDTPSPTNEIEENYEDTPSPTNEEDKDTPSPTPEEEDWEDTPSPTNGEDGKDKNEEYSWYENNPSVQTRPTRDPTPKPTIEYIPRDFGKKDPIATKELTPDTEDFTDDALFYHGLGGKVGDYLDGVETPKEMETDKTLQVVGGIFAGLFLGLLLITAHLVMNYPDGLCAGCCRLILKIICCFTRTLCLPCRAICCRGSDQSQGRRTHAPMRTPFPTDLELA